jgi:L-cysteine S-thiosulfotransferase
VNWFRKSVKAGLLTILLGFLPQLAWAQTDLRKSGTSFLSPHLQALQNDHDKNPAQLWIERGQNLWQAQCASCHGEIASLKKAVASYPKLNSVKKLINLEDHVQDHATLLASNKPSTEEVLALSAALHQAAKGERINTAAIEPHFISGQQLYNQRMGRINLACVHCHDQKVGTNMRGDVISQAQPTGFPIYRQSWQTLGTLERRLRACYSGVQAPLPAIGSAELRELELFLKVRANGMVLEGASVRR